jgi:hypothetical protein
VLTNWTQSYYKPHDEDTNKPDPGIWKTKDNVHAECAITKSSSAKKTLPNLQKATADKYRLINWRKSNDLQEELPDSVLDGE